MQQRLTELQKLEENKDESKEKDNFLNQDEKIVQIKNNGNSLFRCLAHQIYKKQYLYEDVKNLVSDLLKNQKGKLVPAVLNEDEFNGMSDIEIT